MFSAPAQSEGSSSSGDLFNSTPANSAPSSLAALGNIHNYNFASHPASRVIMKHISYYFRESSIGTSSPNKHPSCRNVGGSPCCPYDVPYARSGSSGSKVWLPSAVGIWWASHTTQCLGSPDATSDEPPTFVATPYLLPAPCRWTSRRCDQPFPVWVIP